MENESFEIIDHLLRTKAFDELSDDEKLLILEHVGEKHEYNQLQSLVRQASNEQQLVIDSSVKASLMAKMRSKHRPAWMSIFTYKVPAYAALIALLLVGFSLFVFSPIKEVPIEKIVEIPAEPVIDTVRIVSKPDTIFVDRIVRVEVPVYLTVKEEPKNSKTKNRAVVLSGKSLADQKELRSLLEDTE